MLKILLSMLISLHGNQEYSNCRPDDIGVLALLVLYMIVTDNLHTSLSLRLIFYQPQELQIFM